MPVPNDQQHFWKNVYSKEYLAKNDNFDQELLIKGWAKMVEHLPRVQKILECGSNIGRNILALNHLMPTAEKSIIELSEDAFRIVTSRYQLHQAFNGAIVDCPFEKGSFDLVYIMGVLIHIHPDDLLANMQQLFDLSSKYILMGEYFNHTPTMIEYQGQANKLFKRDFGRYFLENFDVKVIDYGFLWGHIYEPGGFGDVTWWLFEKK